MRVWQVLTPVQLALMVVLSGSWVSVLVLPGWTNDSIAQTNLDQPATTVTEWIAQIEASVVQIMGVRVEETEAGLQVILETAEGSLELPETRSVGNALIVDK